MALMAGVWVGPKKQGPASEQADHEQEQEYRASGHRGLLARASAPMPLERLGRVPHTVVKGAPAVA